MSEVKTRAALRLLSKKEAGHLLHLDNVIDTHDGGRREREILDEKHPPAEPVDLEAIVNETPELVHQAILMPWMPVAFGKQHCGWRVLLAHLGWMQ